MKNCVTPGVQSDRLLRIVVIRRREIGLMLFPHHGLFDYHRGRQLVMQDGQPFQQVASPTVGIDVSTGLSDVESEAQKARAQIRTAGVTPSK
jgi:hypothetical protein